MAKKLACRLGRHEWTTRVEGGENYKVCAACGKSLREPSPPGQGQPYHPAGVDPHPGEPPLLPPPPE